MNIIDTSARSSRVAVLIIEDLFMQIDSASISRRTRGSRRPAGKYNPGIRAPAGLCMRIFSDSGICKVLGIPGDRGAARGRGEPVYNKAQYPRISLSCIFNDFLGDFGRSAFPNREGEEKKGGRGNGEIGIVKTELLPRASTNFTHCSRPDRVYY